jgi:Septum formation
MAPPDEDPFEGLRLDEGFVRAARFIEPAAAERGKFGDQRRSGQCQVVPAHRGLPGFFHGLVWPPHPRRRPRRVAQVLAVLAVAVGMISLMVVTLRHNVGRGGTAAAPPPSAANRAGRPASTASAPESTAVGVQIPAAVLRGLHRGDCVTWEPAGRPAVAGAKVVTCGEAHVAEVTRIVELGSQFTGWPGRDVLDALAVTACPAALAGYVDGSRRGLAPVVGSLLPSVEGWTDGVRRLACTVQGERLKSWTGSVAATDLPA